jgi:nicotinate (nicotinamide) nucleotide adenylyltransferase
MRFVYKAAGTPSTVAILAGAFNPPTAAHLALAEAAFQTVDEVLLAIPQSFPHKTFDGAPLEQRLDMMQRLARSRHGLSAAVAEGGLFGEIAREARPHYPDAAIYLLCGRDAAERIINWEYDDPSFVDDMLAEFSLLVAPRGGEFKPPDRFRTAARTLHMGDYDECSSTRLRDAIRAGENWRPLVPDAIADIVKELYGLG